MDRLKDWRPRRFADVVGIRNQETVRLLQATAKARRSVAALLIGDIGTGKTSFARILMASYNCLNPDLNTADPCWSCKNCVRCNPEHNGEWLTYQTWEIDCAHKKVNREYLSEIIDTANAGFIPPLIFADELARLDEATAQPVLLKFVEDLKEGVFIAAAMSDEGHDFKRHKIHPALSDRLSKFHFFKPSFDEVIEFFMQRLLEWEITADKNSLQQLLLRTNGSFRECLRILDNAQLINEGRLDRFFLDQVIPNVESEPDTGLNPFADDTE